MDSIHNARDRLCGRLFCPDALHLDQEAKAKAPVCALSLIEAVIGGMST